MAHFSRGQIVVHPQHGPATVDKISKRTVGGVRRKYLALTVRQNGMQIALPLELVEEIGVREVVDMGGVRGIFELLAADSEPHDNVWSRRFKAYNERLRSGNLRTLAGLVRDITRRDEEKKVSYGEANILREAMAVFTAELSIALGECEERVEKLVNDVVRERTVPELSQQGLALAS